MSTPDPNDYANLINEAESAVKAKDAASKKQSAPPNPILRQALLTGMLAALVATSAWTIWSHLAPPSQSHVAHDLEQAIEQARATVDAARKATGALPKALPNAALAAVVRYEPAETNYKLTATILGVRVTLESNGTKSTDFGVKE